MMSYKLSDCIYKLVIDKHCGEVYIGEILLGFAKWKTEINKNYIYNFISNNLKSHQKLKR